MTSTERDFVLRERRFNRRPWHSPPHLGDDPGAFLVTAACFEHRPVVGTSPTRMAQFERTLLSTLDASHSLAYAWVILPNHYHVLLKTASIRDTLAAVGKLHGSTSFLWNGEEDCRGRQVWHRAAETAMKSDRHFWATLVYVLNNPVKHKYVEKWQDWPYSNAREFLEQRGRDEAIRLWNEFPIGDYGSDWDPADL